jgi:hypothetical protein
MRNKTQALLWVIVLVLALPIAAWAFAKPVRVLAPQFEGLSCVGRVCVDDVSRVAEALALYRGAVAFVDGSVGVLQSPPRALFCSTPACSADFGFGRRQAYTVGTFGIAISDRGWRPYYVRHELIHHLQNEHLGSVRNSFFKPAWFREGMAYSLSGDPRTLPEPLQRYRAQFDAWLREVGMAGLWSQAERL